MLNNQIKAEATIEPENYYNFGVKIQKYKLQLISHIFYCTDNAVY